MNAASRLSVGYNHYGGKGLDAHCRNLASYKLSERLRFGGPRYIHEMGAPMGPGEFCASGYYSGEIDRSYLDGPSNAGWQLFIPHWIPFMAAALPCLCAVVYRAEKRPRRKGGGTLASEL